MNWMTKSVDQLEYLASLNRSDFVDWFELACMGKTWPILFGDRELYNFILENVEIMPPGLRQNVSHAIYYLIDSFNELMHNYEYLNHLLILAGALNVSKCKNVIYSWIDKKRFSNIFACKNKKIKGEDLHLTCLQLADSFYDKNDNLLIECCKRDIIKDRYMAICFRILWETKTEYLNEYFHLFVDGAAKNIINPNYQLNLIIDSRGTYLYNCLDDLIFNGLNKILTVFIVSRLLPICYGKNNLIATKLAKYWHYNVHDFLDTENNILKVIEPPDRSEMIMLLQHYYSDAKKINQNILPSSMFLLASLGIPFNPFAENIDSFEGLELLRNFNMLQHIKYDLLSDDLLDCLDYAA